MREGATTDLQSDSERGLRAETQAGERITISAELGEFLRVMCLPRCVTRWRGSSAGTSPGRSVTRSRRSPAPPWRGSSAPPPAAPPTTARSASSRRSQTATGPLSHPSRTATAPRRLLRWARLSLIPSCHNTAHYCQPLPLSGETFYFPTFERSS